MVFLSPEKSHLVLAEDTVDCNQRMTSPPLSALNLSAFALEAKLPQKSIVSLDSNNQKAGEIIAGFSLESSASDVKPERDLDENRQLLWLM